MSSNNLKPYLPELKNALNHFLDLLLSFPEITSEQKTAAEKIRHFDFEQYHDTVSWYVSLNIYDYELQMRQTNRKGPYMRSWSIWCEHKILIVEAESSIDFNKTEPSHFDFFSRIILIWMNVTQNQKQNLILILLLKMPKIMRLIWMDT